MHPPYYTSASSFSENNKDVTTPNTPGSSSQTYTDDDKYKKYQKATQQDKQEKSVDLIQRWFGPNSRATKETVWKIKFIFVIGLLTIVHKIVTRKSYCINLMYYQDYQKFYHGKLENRNYTSPSLTAALNIYPKPEKHSLLHSMKPMQLRSLNGIKGQFKHDNSIDVTDDYICCYRDPNNPNQNIGRPFPNTPYVRKHWYKYMQSRTLPLNYKMYSKPQLVTAFSANHFHEHVTHVPNIKEKFPGQKVVVYDLGLEPEQVQYLQSNPDFYIYKKFDYGDYPDHVRVLKNYAWKTLIWAETLPEYGSILWFDTSIYFFKNANEAIYKHIVEQDTCWVFYIKAAAHDIASFTHPKLWGYFPSNYTKYNTPDDSYMKMAGAVIIYDTDKCRYNILKWAILCALTKDCISPAGSRKSCPPDNGYSYNQQVFNHTNDGMQYDGNRLTVPKGKPEHQQFEMCHRFDQAVTSILVENFNGYNQDISWLQENEQLGKPVRNGYHRLSVSVNGKRAEFMKGEVDPEDKMRSPDEYEDEWDSQQAKLQHPLAPKTGVRSKKKSDYAKLFTDGTDVGPDEDADLNQPGPAME